jgi:glycerophosphoryl diester phosphodiesterase
MRRPLLIAHRGESFDAPENTMASFALAWARNDDAIELDVHLTADDQLIVCHDGDTQRTAGVKRIIRDEALAVLQELDLSNGEKMPTLEQVLRAMPAGKQAFVEIKIGPEAVQPLVKVLERLNRAAEEIIVMSFNIDTVRVAKSVLPEHETLWLVGQEQGAPTIDEMIRQAKAVGARGLNLQASPNVNALAVQRIHDAGLACHVWTIDDPALARKMIAIGVDGVTTNRAAWMGEQLTVDSENHRRG